MLDENLCFIALTTLKEVRLLIVDEAFKRRFTTIFLDEPSDEQLMSIKNMFEKNVLKELVLNRTDSLYVINGLRERLSEQYFSDKLIDFLDYMYSFKLTIDKNIDFKKLLEVYVNDQNFEILNSKC